MAIFFDNPPKATVPRPSQRRRRRPSDRERRRSRQQSLCIRTHLSTTHFYDASFNQSTAQTQRFSTGITNFSAVCVGEKPTTFVSFKPHFRPAARTSFSVICFC